MTGLGKNSTTKNTDATSQELFREDTPPPAQPTTAEPEGANRTTNPTAEPEQLGILDSRSVEKKNQATGNSVMSGAGDVGSDEWNKREQMLKDLRAAQQDGGTFTFSTSGGHASATDGTTYATTSKAKPPTPGA